MGKISADVIDDICCIRIMTIYDCEGMYDKHALMRWNEPFELSVHM